MMTLGIFLATIEDHREKDKFELLYHKYEKLVLRISYNILGNQYDMEEAAQDAFFTLAKNIHKLNLDAGEKTKIYVCKTAVSAARSLQRRKCKQPSVTNIEDYDNIPATTEMDCGMMDVAQRCVAKLPKGQRDAMMLYHVSGMGVEAIADSLSITPAAVRTRLTRGNKALKAMLQEVENEG